MTWCVTEVTGGCEEIEGITFGQLDENFDACTSAVEALARPVHQQEFQFPETREVAREYSAEYVDALTTGLQSRAA